MKSRVLVDTNVIIDAIKQKSPAVDVLEGLEVVSISFITAFELLAGCRNLREQLLMEELLSGYEIYQASPEISNLAFELFKSYKLSNGVDIADCFVAATALCAKLTLITANRKHFSFIDNLKLVKPY